MNNSLRLKGIFLVIFAALCWGVSGTVAQYLFQSAQFTTEWMVVVRMISAGILLLLIGVLKGEKSIFKIWKTKSDAFRLILFGVLGMLGVQYTYFAAINHGNAATATILQYLAPIIITIYLSISNRTLPNFKQVFCMCMALMGTFLIITKGSISNLSISYLAIFWGIASAFASALYTLQPISLLERYGSICVVGWGMLIGGIALSFIYPPFDCTGIWEIKSVAAIIFVILFGTLSSFYCYLESLKYIKPYEASILGCIEPLSASFLSIIFLNVRFSFIQWIGALCIIVTVTILSIIRR